jgi:peptide/nickel transport system substrate-binding protein
MFGLFRFSHWYEGNEKEEKMKKKSVGSMLCIVLLVLSTMAVFGAGAKEQVQKSEFKQEMVYLSDQEPKSMDPVFTEGYATLVLALFYDPLLREENGQYIGVLAESYSLSEDDLSIIFNLRKGIKFHDGTDFNAQAVKWNLDRARGAEKSQYARDLKSIAEVSVVDDYTVEIKLTAPDAALLDQFIQPIGYMVSPTAVAKFGDDFQLTAVGTGPYLFQEWSGGNRVVGVRNEAYWRSDKEGNRLPYSDKAIIRFVTEASVAMIELQSGNADILRSSLIADFTTAEADPKLQIIDPGLGTYQYCGLNNLKAPFNNEKLRQALNAAIDRETIARVISDKYGKVLPNFISPLSWVFDPDVVNPYSYNPELARKLLAEAGYPNGFDTTISIIKRDPDVEIGQLIQFQLAKVGINVNVEIMERQGYVEKVVTNRSYELATMLVYTRANRGVFLIENHFGGLNASMNFARFDDPEIADLITRAKTEKDLQTRFDLYSQAQQLVLDRAYWTFLFLRPTYILASKDVVDYKYTSTNGGELSLADVKITAK